jgi:hypothetical protein
MVKRITLKRVKEGKRIRLFIQLDKERRYDLIRDAEIVGELLIEGVSPNWLNPRGALSLDGVGKYYIRLWDCSEGGFLFEEFDPINEPLATIAGKLKERYETILKWKNSLVVSEEYSFKL